GPDARGRRIGVPAGGPPGDRRAPGPRRRAHAPRVPQRAVRSGTPAVSALVRPSSRSGALVPAPDIVRLLRDRQVPDEPRPRSLARTAVTGLWLVAVLVQIAALTIWLTRGGPRLPASFAGGPWALVALSLCSLLTLSMGAFLARRLPGNLVGWVMMI